MRVIKYQNTLEVHQVVMALKNGEVVVLPTDTVYGICGNGFDEKIYQKIYQIKKRPRNKFFPLFVRDFIMAQEIAYVNPKEKEFLKNIWPGKVSVVLKIKSDLLKKIYKNDTVALRMPQHHIISEIFEFIDFPIIGTSANLSGWPDLNDPKKIFNQFKEAPFQPDYILDYGILPESQNSTIIDISGDAPKIIRQGAVSAEHLIKLWTSL